MKKFISLTLALVMIVTCLAGISFAADPIATVVTGAKSIDVASLEELLAAIDPSGNSVVTMKADVTGSAQIIVPYSCTVDFAGHTWMTTKGNAFRVQNAGSENPITVLKNGVVDGFVLGVRVDKGGLQMENMIVTGRGAVAVALYETDTQYNDKNSIKGCTIVGARHGCFGFNNQDHKQTGCKMFIENSVLAEVWEAGNPVFTAKMGDGTVVLGKGVDMYSYKVDSYASKTNVEGEAVTAEFAVASVKVPELNVNAAGLSHWRTAEYVAPAEPEVPAEPTPEVPTTSTPDTTAPATGVSVVALGVMALVSLAGAAIVKKH